ncbi:retrovirus-related pol polyprotein from transposon TNT 1-94 [Tanacetum coccineum]
MPIKITFDNPIDFNDHFSKPKDLKKDLPISFDSTELSILPPSLLDSDSPFTAEFSASVTLNSLENEDKVFKPGILVYHAIHDKNLVTLEENLKENISSGTLLVFKEPSLLLPPPEPPDECLNFEPILVMKNVVLNEDFYQSEKTLLLNVKDVDSFTFIIWIFRPYFTYTEDSPLIFSFRSEDTIFDPGIVTFHKPVACTDISKITRKQSKTGKHEHEKRKSTKEARDSKPKPEKVKLQSKIPKLQTVEDLQGDALLHYDVEVELMNLILLSIPNDIYNSQFEKLVNVSRAKKLEKSHDPLALVAHTGSSSRNTSSYYVTHPTSVVDYEDEYQQDDVHTNSEDPLASAMLVNIQSRNSGNVGRNNRRAYVQEEIVEGSNAPNETGNVQRTLRTSSSGNTSTVQCYNCSGKGHYARNCPKPRVRDSKYFMEQMLLAKQDEAGVILTDEQNDFLFADASRMEEIEELSANICLMARIQPADNTSDVGPSYDSAFISKVQSSSNNENEEQMYPTHTKIINSTIGDDQIDSDMIFDSPKRNVNSGSIEKDTHVPDLCALEQLARNAYQEAEKQQIFAQKVQKQNMTLTSQLELYKERVRILENINEDNNYLNEILEADKRAIHFSQQAQS